MSKTKTILFALFWFAVGIYFVFLMSASNRALDNHICSIEYIDVDHAKGNYFVTADDVKMLMEREVPALRSGTATVKDINLSQLEKDLESNPYITHAEVAVNLEGKMQAKVEQIYPLARVVNMHNQSYYITKSGDRVATSQEFSARVPIVSGYVNEPSTSVQLPDEDKKTAKASQTTDMLALYNLLTFIDNDPFWKAQIEQLYIKKNQDAILIPKVGDHELELGKIENIEEKFKRLFIFHAEGLPNTGWSKYEKVSVKFNNQIVCTKK